MDRVSSSFHISMGLQLFLTIAAYSLFWISLAYFVPWFYPNIHAGRYEFIKAAIVFLVPLGLKSFGVDHFDVPVSFIRAMELAMLGVFVAACYAGAITGDQHWQCHRGAQMAPAQCDAFLKTISAK